jgi:stage V sporulation protein D (sporulation-specific penicillin-binding protein)
MRVRLLFYFFVISLLAISLRLGYWQIIKGTELASAAALQRSSVRQIPASRGVIYAQDGKLLVGNEPGYLLFASTVDLKEDPAKIAHLLAPIILASLSEDQSQLSLVKDQTLPPLNLADVEGDLAAKLKKSGDYYIPLARSLKQKYVDEIAALKIPALGFDPQPRRLYPEGSMAATTLGFVGSSENGKGVGYYGLEGFYNGELAGQSGLERLEHDASGQPILIGSFDLEPPSDGRNLVTTIDRYVQFIVEKRLREGLQKYGAKEATAIVMDPKTGNIIASATLPSFDPRGYSFFDKSFYQDGATADTYEPGSTFKMVTMAAGLDTGTVTPTTICPVCDKAFNVQGHDLETWNNKYFPSGSENMTNVLEHSDNVGAAWVGTKIGKDTFYRYAKAFGVGDKTGVDLEGEEQGVFYDSAKNIQPIDLATMSFGQGFSLTALKMTQILATIANKGLMMQPRLVSQIIDGDRKIDLPVRSVRQVIKPETAHSLGLMLKSAVENGEARNIIPHGFRVAGKTGTAQVPIAGHYDSHKTVASFVGFAPIEDPKFVMIVKYTEPTASPFAALTAEPTFFDITKDLYGYFGLAPTPNLH